MKKFLAILSLVCFIAFTSHAQEPKSATSVAKKESSVSSTDTKAPAHACCVNANKACCKNNAGKTCTTEQKAECAKAGAAKTCNHGDKAKAEEMNGKTEAAK